jgi:hypothetical protein
VLFDKRTGIEHKLKTKQFRARRLSSLLLAIRNHISANKNILQMKMATFYIVNRNKNK